jgi:hypothetical protein
MQRISSLAEELLVHQEILFCVIYYHFAYDYTWLCIQNLKRMCHAEVNEMYLRTFHEAPEGE